MDSSEYSSDSPLLVWERPLDRLNQYLKNHHHLFTLIGVFAALAGYIRAVANSTDAPSQTVTVSLFATFALVIFLVIVAYTRMAIKIKKSDFRARDWENIGLVIFAGLFGIIVSLLWAVIMNYQRLWFAVLAPLAVAFALIAGLYVIGFTFIFTEYAADYFGIPYSPLGFLAEVVLLAVSAQLMIRTSLLSESLWAGFQPGMPVIDWLRIFLGMVVSVTWIYALLLILIGSVALLQKWVVPRAVTFLSQ